MKTTRKFWEEKLGTGWTSVLKDTLRDPYMEKLLSFLNKEYGKNEIYPCREDIFRAFKLCPWENVKVVILGLDPAWDTMPNGLAYGSNSTSEYRSLVQSEIRKRIEYDFYDGLNLNFDFTLESWAEQGVLLLNTALTAPKFRSMAHKKPWNQFIKAVIKALNDYNPGTIFMFWGWETQYLIPDLKNQEVLTCEHPATAGKEYENWETNIFLKCNEILYKRTDDRDYRINW